MPRAFLVKGKADRKRSTLLADENHNRNAEIQPDFSNQGWTKVKAMPSQVSPPVYIEKYGREPRTGKKIFLKNEDFENRFTAQKRVFESPSESAQSFQARKTKGKKALKVVQEEAGMQEQPFKKRRKQQQPYHKVVYYYPVPEPEQIEEIENEHESQITQSVPHEVHHYANCSTNQGAVPRLSSHKQTDSPCSPGSETTQPCYYYHPPQEASDQAQAQPRARHNSDSRDEAENAKQLDFERLDRGLSEAEILQRKRERRVARERQSLSPRYVVIEQRIPPKVVAERNSEAERTAEVEVPPNVNVQYIPVETRQNHEYQRHQIYTNAVEEAEDNSGVPEISSVGVLRECAPTSPPSSLTSSYAPASSSTPRSSTVTQTHSPPASAPSSYQQQTQVVQSYQVQPNVTVSSYQPQPSSYPTQSAVSNSYQPRPCAPIYPPQLSPVMTNYPPQASPATTNYPPQPSPIAASFPPQSTAFGYPPQPNPVTAAYPPPQATQASVAYPLQPSLATVSYPPQSSPSYNHHSYPPQLSPAVADTPQAEPTRIDPAYPQITSPKVGQTPPIVHYVPVYAVQGPSGEQKYVAGPPINTPPADPSKVIPPPPSVLEKYPSAPSIPQAVQQNAIAYPSSYRMRVASDPGPTASAPPQLQPQPAPHFQQVAPQPLQVPQPQRYPVPQPLRQPYPPSQAYPQHPMQQLHPAQQLRQQPKPYQQPQQPLHYAPPLRDAQHRSNVYRVPEVCETARVVEEQDQSLPLQIRRIENHNKWTLKPKKNRPVLLVVPPNKDCTRDIPSSPDSLRSNPSPVETIKVKTEPSDPADNHLHGTSCVITPPGSPDDEESDSDEGETYTVIMRDQGMQTLPVKGGNAKLANKTNNARHSYINKNSVRKHDVEQTRKVDQIQKENIYVQNSNLPTMAVIVPRPSHMIPPDPDDTDDEMMEEDKGIERYHCSFCTKGFQWHSHLKSHERTHTGEKPFKCSECGRCFTRADGLQCHMLVHNKKKPFKCQYCSKSFSESSQLEKHVYLHTGIKPFKCEYCGRAFSDSQSIEKHLLVHTGTKPYKCQYCVRSFNDSQMLVKHIRSHTGEKPFKCRNCTMAFSKQSALIIHNRVHTGEKPYQCPHCHKSFSISGNLQRHILIHTGERPYRCSKCPKAFNNPSHLSRHISKLHAPRNDDGPASQVHEMANAPIVEVCEQ